MQQLGLAVPPTSLAVWCRAGTVDAAYPYLLHLGLQVRGEPEPAFDFMTHSSDEATSSDLGGTLDRTKANTQYLR